MSSLASSVEQLKHRGPDNQSHKLYSNVGLAHSRLSIIDTSESANQPFTDESGRYCLVFNGEIYNYKDLRSELEQNGVQFRTNSDTEVLFQLLIREGEDCLEKLNGFFAFAFFDSNTEKLLLVRDRFGIKPLVVFEDEDAVIFSSEIAPLFEFDICLNIDQRSLNHFFALTYVPGPATILENVDAILPGELMRISSSGAQKYEYYKDSVNQEISSDYTNNKSRLIELLENSVQLRLVSDVPIGSYLSGGLDSSVVAFLAKKHKSDLQTFSVGFDHPYFDESKYAEEVAKHIGSKHETIQLQKQDFKNRFDEFLDRLTEPFGDSSAFASFMLAEKTKQSVTVSLSGDGADELFAGYRKHMAEYQLRSMGVLKKTSLKALASLTSGASQSRDSRSGEFFRKLQKFRQGMRYSNEVRYWEWCKFIDDQDRQNLLKDPLYQGLNIFFNSSLEEMNDVLMADQSMVLPDDMLKKVDLTSMANSLEVRTPFLDHRVVELANSLPIEHKIKNGKGKWILRDAFKEHLPANVFNRPKSGFEIPIREWLNDEIERILNSRLFSEEYLEKQELFNPLYIKELKLAWKDPRFGDKIYLVWSLIIFQSWWAKYMETRL